MRTPGPAFWLLLLAFVVLTAIAYANGGTQT